MDVQALNTLLQSAAPGQGVVLIDVRTPAEYAGGHVPQAVNKPLDQLPQWLKTLPKDQVIPVICQSGMRSANAVSQLRAAGVNAVNVTGGTSAWRAAGYPVSPS